MATALVVATAVTSEARTRNPKQEAPRFDFVYETGWGDKLDTYDSTLTKDLVGLRDTTIHVVVSQADRDSVLLEMQAIDFFGLPEPQPPYPRCGGYTEPSTSVRIEATLGGKTHRLVWDTGSVSCTEGDLVWTQIIELRSLILRIMKRQPGYDRLPRPYGGYY